MKFYSKDKLKLTIEDHLCLPIGPLVKQKLFKTGKACQGSLKWNNGAAISYILRPMDDRAELTLMYKLNGETDGQQIELTKKPSNLGRGHVWYFICPATGKQCRKMYFFDGGFHSRHAMEGVLYKSQTRSKLDRMAVPAPDDWPSSRPTEYAGKLTKPYARHLKQIERSDEAILRFVLKYT